MNAELVNKALEKVLNANVLVILVSRRVRQLNAGGGGLSRPLIANVGNLGAADVALREIIEGKSLLSCLKSLVLACPIAKKHRKSQHGQRIS
jgi:DNA-directed RNA polymerase subunit K/omega